MAQSKITLARVERAAILSRALKGWPTLTKRCRSRETGGLTFQVNGKPPYIHTLTVDTKTGNAALKMVKRLIRRELTALGVKLPKRERS